VPSIEDLGDTVDYGAMLKHYDGYDLTAAQHYFDVLDWARKHCPVEHSDAYGGYWIVSKHDEIRQVLSDPHSFSNSQGIIIPVEDRLRKPPQDLDPPLQTDFRRLLNRYFSRHGLARHSDRVHQLAEQHIDAVLPKGDRALGGGGCDVIQDIAKPLTSAVLNTAILDLQDPVQFADTSALVEAIGYGSAEANSLAFARLQVLVDRLLDEMADREEQDDVINAVLHGVVEGRPLTRNEQVGTIMQLLLGGLKTTVAALGHIVQQLAAQPELEAQLREPDWSRRYLDEFLRLEPPVKMIARTAMRDVVVGTQQVAAGEMVAVMLGSANRDESVFERADELCLDREKNPHLSFGLGVHRCIGSNLARLEIESTIDALLARVTNIRLVPGSTLTRTPAASELSWERVPVEFDLV